MSVSQPFAVSITLDQLIALNDEIASLVRLGVPLEEGLTQVGKEAPGRTGKLAAWVAEQLRQGQSLEQILAECPEMFPPVYRAVVQAGVKSGRLPAALESVAASSRRLAQSRRMVVAGLIYPLIVLLVAWGLFVFYTVVPAHMFLRVVDELQLPGRAFFATLADWGQSASYWGPAVALAVLLIAGLWCLVSAKASLADANTARFFFGWIPGMGRLLCTYQAAAFTDLLALLVEHRVTLPEALELAADTTGGRRLVDASRKLAEALRRGESLKNHARTMRGLPPLAGWLMASGGATEALAKTLRHVAEVYQQRAQYQSEAARIFVPVFLTLLIGGGATLAYALLVLGNWFRIVRVFA